MIAALSSHHRQQHDQEENSPPGENSRRSVLISSVTAVLMGMTTSLLTLSTVAGASAAVTTTTVAAAAVGGGAIQSARVARWPGIENLEPLYELKLSIDALSTAVSDPTNWPFVQRRLEKFFQGSIFSEKNFYFGVGLQYMNEIQYDKAELPNYVLLDKEARFDALDRTMKSLERLKTSLASPNAAVLNDVIVDTAKESQASLASFFALLPPKDYQAVQELFEHVQKADVNRDGKISDEEITVLTIPEQELWKKRVEKFG